VCGLSSKTPQIKHKEQGKMQRSNHK
jgi:hypothetical protein